MAFRQSLLSPLVFRSRGLVVNFLFWNSSKMSKVNKCKNQEVDRGREVHSGAFDLVLAYKGDPNRHLTNWNIANEGAPFVYIADDFYADNWRCLRYKRVLEIKQHDKFAQEKTNDLPIMLFLPVNTQALRNLQLVKWRASRFCEIVVEWHGTVHLLPPAFCQMRRQQSYITASAVRMDTLALDLPSMLTDPKKERESSDPVNNCVFGGSKVCAFRTAKPLVHFFAHHLLCLTSWSLASGSSKKATLMLLNLGIRLTADAFLQKLLQVPQCPSHYKIRKYPAGHPFPSAFTSQLALSTAVSHPLLIVH